MTNQLTTTSYCLLGLLRLRPFSAYELTKYMQRSALARLWPRTEAAIYREGNRLVEARLATATTERRGKRARSIYEITDAGRSALESWLSEPGDDLRFECETAVKVFFADASDLATLRAHLERLRADQVTRARELAPAMAGWLEGQLEFPERIQYTAMAADLIGRISLATKEWADDWLERIEEWESTALDEQAEGEARSVIASLHETAARG